MQATDAPFQSTLVYNAWLKSMVEQHGKKAHQKNGMFDLQRTKIQQIDVWVVKI